MEDITFIGMKPIVNPNKKMLTQNEDKPKKLMGKMG